MSHFERFLSKQITCLPDGTIWFPPTSFECPCTVQTVPQNYLYFLTHELNLDEDQILSQLTLCGGDVKKLLESHTVMGEI